MFGYDWPRLHAALNDLPAALLLVAVLFDLLAGRPGTAVLPAGGVLDPDRRRDRRGGGGAVGPAGRGAHRPRGGGAPGHGDPRAARLHHPGDLRRSWRSGGSWRERRMGATERAWRWPLSLGGVGVLIATAIYGGKLVFDHAAGIPTEVLTAEMQERAEGHHHARGRGARRRVTSTTAPAPVAATRPPQRRRRRRRRSTGDSAAQPRARAPPGTAMRPARRRTSTSADAPRAGWIAAARVAACQPEHHPTADHAIPRGRRARDPAPAARGHAPPGGGAPGRLDPPATRASCGTATSRRPGSTPLADGRPARRPIGTGSSGSGRGPTPAVPATPCSRWRPSTARSRIRRCPSASWSGRCRGSIRWR